MPPGDLPKMLHNSSLHTELSFSLSPEIHLFGPLRDFTGVRLYLLYTQKRCFFGWF